MAMEGWTKLYERIVQSSVWRESSDVRVVWITLLALKDREGCIYGTPEWLADQARVDDEVCQAALKKFLSPDKRSRNSANDGRRIKVIQGGWKVLNHEFYRDGMEDMREKWRRQKMQQRKKKVLTAREMINKTVAEDPITKQDERMMREKWGKTTEQKLTKVEQEYDIEREGQ